MTVKIPEPITAPMPSAVSDHGPSVFLRQFSGFSESRISLSMDLRDSSWLARVKLLAYDFACRRLLVESSLPNNTGPATPRQDWKKGSCLELRNPNPLSSRPCGCPRSGSSDLGFRLLALRLAASCLLQLLFVFAACAGAWTLRGRLLACRALDLFAFQYIFHCLGVCHRLLFSCDFDLPSSERTETGLELAGRISLHLF